MTAAAVTIRLSVEAAQALRTFVDDHREDLPPGLALTIRLAVNSAVVLSPKD